jgi:hypothetical protein
MFSSQVRPQAAAIPQGETSPAYEQLLNGTDILQKQTKVLQAFHSADGYEAGCLTILGYTPKNVPAEVYLSYVKEGDEWKLYDVNALLPNAALDANNAKIDLSKLSKTWHFTERAICPKREGIQYTPWSNDDWDFSSTRRLVGKKPN